MERNDLDDLSRDLKDGKKSNTSYISGRSAAIGTIPKVKKQNKTATDLLYGFIEPLQMTTSVDLSPNQVRRYLRFRASLVDHEGVEAERDVTLRFESADDCNVIHN